jgi:hypothetical protein
MVMTEVSLDELGPVDYLVVECPAGASSFTGERAAMEPGKHGWGAHLREPVGGGLRVSSTAFGRSADRRRTDSQLSIDRRRDRNLTQTR